LLRKISRFARISKSKKYDLEDRIIEFAKRVRIHIYPRDSLNNGGEKNGEKKIETL
jgi:hypothetical protein